jgi:HD superfamily phosphohydrolase
MTGAETYRGKGLIVDPIHGYLLYTRPAGLITGEATEQDLLDTPWVQRLRRIPQLQSARWVFPTAEHSRFPHALGAMHVAGRFAQQLWPSLRAVYPDAPSAPLVEELLRVAGLLHDVGHGPFGHFFDDNFLADFDLTHELVGQRIIREDLGDIIRGLRRSPHGFFAEGEAIDPEWICYLMGKGFTQPMPGDPRWLAFLKPVLSGIYTADNLDYVLRDAHMCGVAVGTDLDRIIYYSFFTPEGLTLDRSGTQALIMFLTARYYMYTNVYYHRTTRAIDLHLKEIFRPTMRIVFPWDLRKDLHPYLHLTEWTLLEEVGRWHDADDPERRALGQEWRQILDRRLRWRMVHEEVLDDSQITVWGRMRPEFVTGQVRDALPRALRDTEFQVDLAFQDPRPLNPLAMGDRQIYVYDGATNSVSAEPLAELFRYLPGKVAQCRIFARDHRHDRELTEAFRRVLYEDRSAGSPDG